MMPTSVATSCSDSPQNPCRLTRRVLASMIWASRSSRLNRTRRGRPGVCGVLVTGEPYRPAGIDIRRAAVLGSRYLPTTR
ncbi:hypothetical protein Cde04nite_04250 [Cellulomonas denverensis]|nr:hypothetical protein Cde04nite_04250 [Cellulomonas denverensis]